ncbi:hypothetical protein [Streptomyces sp. NPDC018031]|uniref:hypothetical protein n=1 Tax=Streptomyces sp. NPDC018031 TaxID=3365033 RepID=UPI003798353C
MPLTTYQRDPDGPRRRDLMLAGGAAGAVALLAGCSDASGPRTDGAGRPSALDRLRVRARRESTALLARYDATIAAHPPLAGRLRPLREETARHLAAFTDGGGPAAPSPGTAGASPPAASGSPAPRRTQPVPERPEEALAALARAERETADARTAALAGAPGEFARLLASVAACGAAHAYLLTEGR